MRRRILQTIQLDKIAAVDRPCQEGAVVTIMKRAAPQAGADEVAAMSSDLGDAIAKSLIVLPMPQQVNTITFDSAWEDAQEWERWCNVQKGLTPLCHALKKSITSILTDDATQGMDRLFKIRESVGQFLDEVQKQYPTAMPDIAQSVTVKRLENIQKAVLVAKAALAALRLAKERDGSFLAPHVGTAKVRPGVGLNPFGEQRRAPRASLRYQHGRKRGRNSSVRAARRLARKP